MTYVYSLFWKQLTTRFCSMWSGVIFVWRSVKIFLYQLNERSTSTEVTGAYCKSVTIEDEKLSTSCISLFPFKIFATFFKIMSPWFLLLKFINFYFYFFSIFSRYLFKLNNCIFNKIYRIKTRATFDFSKFLMAITSIRKWVLINISLFSTVFKSRTDLH